MKIVLFLVLVAANCHASKINSTSGNIFFDPNHDDVSDMSLSSQGLKIGSGLAASSLDVTGTVGYQVH